MTQKRSSVTKHHLKSPLPGSANLSKQAVDNELVDNTGRINPTATDRKRRCRHVSQLTQEAGKATNRCDRRMQRVELRSNPPVRYSVGEKVFVRLPGKAQKKRHVIEAQIEKRNLKTET